MKQEGGTKTDRKSKIKMKLEGRRVRRPRRTLFALCTAVRPCPSPAKTAAVTADFVRASRLIHQRQRNAEDAACANLRLNRDCAVVLLGEMFGDEQAQAEAGLGQ